PILSPFVTRVGPAVPGASPMNPFVQVVQQYGPLFGILAAVATVLGVAFKIYKTAHDHHVKALQDANNERRQEVETLRPEGAETLRPLVEQLRKEVADAERAVQTLQSAHAAAQDAWRSQEAALRGECDRLRVTVQSLEGQLEDGKEELARWDR